MKLERKSTERGDLGEVHEQPQNLRNYIIKRNKIFLNVKKERLKRMISEVRK